MLNADFYPTPAPIIRKMLEPYGDISQRHILEPSAGKGDILDAINGRNRGRSSQGRLWTVVAAIEKAQEAESEFFRIKSHKKGTLHLTFRDEHLWERFNATAVEGKNWLPNRRKAG